MGYTDRDKEKLNKSAKDRFIFEVRRKIVWRLEEPIDVIVADKRKYDEYKQVYGSIIGQAAKEGVAV